jgi:hypothetical protein
MTLDLFTSAAEHREFEVLEKKAYFRDLWRSRPTSPGHIKTYMRRWAEFGAASEKFGHRAAMRLIPIWKAEDATSASQTREAA